MLPSSFFSEIGSLRTAPSGGMRVQRLPTFYKCTKNLLWPECSGKNHYFHTVKILGVIFGSLFLGLGIVGIFVPLLPTTPFLLLAAALYVRSSPRLYAWLLNQRHLGSYIRNFRENRAIPLQAKIVSVSLIWLTMGYCIFRVVDAWWWAQLGLFLLAVGTSWHILSFATLKKKE